MIFSFSSREPNDFLKCPWLSLHHRKCKPTRPGPCLPQESACHPTPAGHETLPPVPAGISSSSQHRPLPQFYHSECLDTHTHTFMHTQRRTPGLKAVSNVSSSCFFLMESAACIHVRLCLQSASSDKVLRIHITKMIR